MVQCFIVGANTEMQSLFHCCFHGMRDFYHGIVVVTLMDFNLFIFITVSYNFFAGVSGSTVHLNSAPLNLSVYIFKHLHEPIQMNVFYNLETKAFSQSLQRAKDEGAFSLTVDVTVEMDHNHMLLVICTGYVQPDLNVKIILFLLKYACISDFIHILSFKLSCLSTILQDEGL